jgi:hypothetical protein
MATYENSFPKLKKSVSFASPMLMAAVGLSVCWIVHRQNSPQAIPDTAVKWNYGRHHDGAYPFLLYICRPSATQYVCIYIIPPSPLPLC